MPRYYDTDGNYTVFGLIGRELLGSELVCLAGVTGNIQDQLNSAGGSAQPICQAMPDGSGTGSIVYSQADFGVLQPIPLVTTADTALGQMYTHDLIDVADNTKLKAPTAGWYRLTYSMQVWLVVDNALSAPMASVLVHRATDTASTDNSLYTTLVAGNIDTQLFIGVITGTTLLPLDANEAIRLHLNLGHPFFPSPGSEASANLQTNDFTGTPTMQSLVIFEKVRDI